MIGKKTNDALPTPDDIAKRTWELFADGADTSDGKWSPDHAAKEAIRRHQELEEGTYGFVARNDTITLLPCLEPYTSLSIVTKEEGQQRLDTALTNFFRNIDEGPRLALRITMGAGKTRQTLKHLQRYLAGQRDQRIEIYVPRHDLAEQYVDDIQSLDGSFDAEVVHILPRVSVDTAKFPDLCKRSDYARSLNAAGLGVFQNACRSNDGERCEYYDECPYIQQFIKPELAPSTRGNVVYILVHSYLGLPRNPLQREPDLVVIDEAFLDVLVDTDTTLDPSDVRKYIKTDKLPTLGRLIVDALEDDQPLLLELRNNDIKPGDLAAVCLDDLLPNVPFTARGNRPVDRSGNSALHRSMSLLLNILQEELALVPNRDAVERLVYVPDQNKIRVSHLKELDFTDSTPILCLDATADAVLLEEILESVKVEQINVHQNAVVTQVFDITGSKAFWDGNTAPVETLVEVANLWTSFGDPSLIVCHKGLSERLQADEKKNPDVKVMHLGNLRGSNAAEDCSVIFLTGRNLPPMAEIDLKARAFFWSAAVPLQHDAGAQFKQSSRHDHMPVHRLRGFVQSCRNKHPQSGVYVKSFSDDRIDALLAQSRDAETMQALGRLRLVHSKTRKRDYPEFCALTW
jgi:hypothetical protein